MLNVADVHASAEFIKTHFGFTESMSVEDKVASLTRNDAGFKLIYLKTGLDTFRRTEPVQPGTVCFW